MSAVTFFRDNDKGGDRTQSGRLWPITPVHTAPKGCSAREAAAHGTRPRIWFPCSSKYFYYQTGKWVLSRRINEPWKMPEFSSESTLRTDRFTSKVTCKMDSQMWAWDQYRASKVSSMHTLRSRDFAEGEFSHITIVLTFTSEIP